MGSYEPPKKYISNTLTFKLNFKIGYSTDSVLGKLELLTGSGNLFSVNEPKFQSTEWSHTVAQLYLAHNRKTKAVYPI